MTDVELIKSKVNIVDIVSEYIQLNNAGSNFKGLCPFHSEKTPSFMVNPSLQIFKCFGCGKGGDVLTFISEIEKLEFTDSLRYLADKFGIILSTNANVKNAEFEKEKENLYKANLMAAQFFSYILNTHKAGEKARKYVQKRKLSGKEIEKFQFGYAPTGYYNLKKFLIKKGFSEKKLVDYGLLVERNGKTIDKFRQRLMQPIFDIRGNIVGFSGRYLGLRDDAPKYLNSPETIVYKKNELLYSLHHSKEYIRKSKYVVLVEGNLDVVSSHRAGEYSVLAPLGTAFTLDQARLIKRYADTIYFCFDNDRAGLNALIRSLSLVEEINLSHKVIDLGKYKDCDEMICESTHLWTEAVSKPVETFDYIIKNLTESLNLDKVDGKTKFYSIIIPILKTIKNEVYKSHYIKKIAIMLEVSETVIIDALNSTTLKSHHQILTEPVKPKIRFIGPAPRREIYFLALILQNKNIKNRSIYSKYFSDDRIRLLLENEDCKSLDQNLKEIYEIALLYDLSAVSDLEAELINLTKKQETEFLKREIKKLRKEMALNPDNEEVIVSLGELIRKMSGV